MAPTAAVAESSAMEINDVLAISPKQPVSPLRLRKAAQAPAGGASPPPPAGPLLRDGRRGEQRNVATTQRVELPELVSGYVERNLPQEGSSPASVRVGQRGRMWLKPHHRQRRFDAVQDYAVETIGFSWQVRFRLAPLVSYRVLDRYENGRASLEGDLAGVLPLEGERGPDTSIGEALRYLAELPWVPQAMRFNEQLEWHQLDEQVVEVATCVGSRRAAVLLEFDDSGDIVRSRAQAISTRNQKSSIPMPWGGEFSDYEKLGGVRIPTRGEVRWQLPDGAFTYWRGEIMSLQVDPASP